MHGAAHSTLTTKGDHFLDAANVGAGLGEKTAIIAGVIFPGMTRFLLTGDEKIKVTGWNFTR